MSRLTSDDASYTRTIKKAADYLVTFGLALAAAFGTGVLFVRLWRTDESPDVGPTSATLSDAALFVVGAVVGFVAILVLRSLIAFIAGWRMAQTRD